MRKIRRFWLIPVIVLLIAGLVLWWWYAFHASGGRPIFTIGKETTFVDGPVLENGHIDYVTALNERLSKGITPEKNAQVLLVKAIGPRPEGGRLPAEYYKWLRIEEPPVGGDYFVRLHKYLEKHVKIEPGGEQGDNVAREMELEKKREEILDNLEQVAKRPWKASDHPHLTGWLKANEKPFAMVAEATKRRQYFMPLVCSPRKGRAPSIMGALTPSVQLCRELSAAFAARAMLRAGEGRDEEAWQDLLTSHLLGRVVSRGASLIELLVGIAIDQIAKEADLVYLSSAKLDSKQVKKRLEDLKKLPPLGNVADKIDLGERFSALDAVMMADRGGVESLSASGRSPSPVTGNIDWDPALRKINRWYDRLAAACREKDRNKRKKLIAQIQPKVSLPRRTILQRLFTTRRERGKQIGEILVGLLFPSLYKVKQAEDRASQKQNNLHIAFALAAYHSDHGRYPDKLERLVPDYMKSIPDDHFSEKPLIYRLTKKGYLLYSVGDNGVNDNGRGREDEPAGDDLSVRMPLPNIKPADAANSK